MQRSTIVKSWISLNILYRYVRVRCARVYIVWHRKPGAIKCIIRSLTVHMCYSNWLRIQLNDITNAKQSGTNVWKYSGDEVVVCWFMQTHIFNEWMCDGRNNGAANGIVHCDKLYAVENLFHSLAVKEVGGFCNPF